MKNKGLNKIENVSKQPNKVKVDNALNTSQYENLIKKTGTALVYFFKSLPLLQFKQERKFHEEALLESKIKKPLTFRGFYIK